VCGVVGYQAVSSRGYEGEDECEIVLVFLLSGNYDELSGQFYTPIALPVVNKHRVKMGSVIQSHSQPLWPLCITCKPVFSVANPTPNP
jgi:hypothetical protein